MKKLNEQICAQIEKVNASYIARVNKHLKPMVFNPGDLVWLYLRNERLLSRRQNKLTAQREGPFELLKRIGDNAYKLELMRDINECHLPYR